MASRRTFDSLNCLSSETLEVLQQLGFEYATPVQEATIPLLCGHKDVAVDACTGSGKTLAFLLPTIEKLRALESPLKKHQVGSVIISPTRELARQTLKVLQPFLACVEGLEATLLVGGGDPTLDVATLEAGGAGILVGTPGRLGDVLERCPFLDLRTLEVLVLDEADRLLDMGFRGHIDAIMARLPKQRRTGLFSATQTDAFNQLARAGLRNPVRVNVAVSAASSALQSLPARGSTLDAIASTSSISRQSLSADQAATVKAGPQRTPASLQIEYMQCEADEKLGQLICFLQAHRQEKVIVYMLTCACVDFWTTALSHVPAAKDLVVHALHGKMKQRVRDVKLAAFATSAAGCLLCTDVAARGLDISNVAWTVQVDAPQDPDAFVHRVGRSARMGARGRALILLTPSEQAYVGFLRLRKVPLEETAAHEGIPNVLPHLRQAAESDRDVMEKGTRAFVSYVRAYKEHHCRFIFRVEELALGRLATAFALLRLPRMPELSRAGDLTHFAPSAADPSAIKYKDRTRQKQWVRKQQLRAAAAAEQAGSPEAGRQAKPRQEPVRERKLPSAKRRQLDAQQDVADFAAEYRMLKKLKKGKVSEEEFSSALGLSRPASEDDDNTQQPAKKHAKHVSQQKRKDHRGSARGTGPNPSALRQLRRLKKQRRKAYHSTEQVT